MKMHQILQKLDHNLMQSQTFVLVILKIILSINKSSPPDYLAKKILN